MQPNDIWEQSEDDLLLAPNKSYLTCSEAAKILNVSTKTIRRWDKQGKIVSIRTEGGHRRISRSEILKIQMISGKNNKANVNLSPESNNPFKQALKRHELKAIKNEFKIIQILINEISNFQTAVIAIKNFITFTFRVISKFNELKCIKKACINLLNDFENLKMSYENEFADIEDSEEIHEQSISNSPRTRFFESRRNASYVFENLIKSSNDNSIPIDERNRSKKIVNDIIEPYKNLTSFLKDYEPGSVEHDVCKLLLTKHPLDYEIQRSFWSVRTLSKVCKTLNTKKCSKSQIGRFYKRIGWSRRINYRLLSPDKEWGNKMKNIALTIANLNENDVLLYGDEFKFTSTKVKEYNIQKRSPAGLNFRLRESPAQYFRPTIGCELTGVFNPKNKQLEVEKLSRSNFEGYLDGLQKVLKRIEVKNKGKIKLIIDNGPIHGSNRLEDRINEMIKTNVEVIYLPTYSPNQNPIERVWKTLLGSVPREANTIEELDILLAESLIAFKKNNNSNIQHELKLYCPICNTKFIFNTNEDQKNIGNIEHHICFNIPYINPYIIQILTNNLDKGEY